VPSSPPPAGASHYDNGYLSLNSISSASDPTDLHSKNIYHLARQQLYDQKTSRSVNHYNNKPPPERYSKFRVSTNPNEGYKEITLNCELTSDSSCLDLCKELCAVLNLNPEKWASSRYRLEDLREIHPVPSVTLGAYNLKNGSKLIWVRPESQPIRSSGGK